MSRLDVAIVGYGPVGQTAAIQLARLGHRVGVFERWPELYPRPRAVHYDDEVARIFQHLGLAPALAAITEPARTYEWRNAAGETLLSIDRSAPGPSGWPGATMFTQPELERLLDRTAKSLPTIDVHQGWEVTGLQDRGGGVLLGAREGTAEGGHWTATGSEMEVEAEFVIGCDGANSFVRTQMETELEDLGFVFDWLIADTVPHDPALLAEVNLQICDPARPTTKVSGGPGRRRWEWMLLPGETREQAERAEFVWELLAQSGVGAGEVDLERFIVYTFMARWAERWREGRLLLAGDAAHLMPPFAGQGMCSGLRDAWTLAWHLDLVLRGVAPQDSLDEYTSERVGHLEHAISMSVELGKVICIADEQEAAARDSALLGLAADPDAPAFEPPMPTLGPGVLDTGPGRTAAGTLFPQGQISTAEGPALLEETIDGGFVLYLMGAAPPSVRGRELLEELSGQVVELCAELDHSGVYVSWFERNECVAALVRPDFYVFGTAAEAADVDGLLERLSVAVTGKDPNRKGSLT